jgi:hypothetical protein
MYLYKYFSIFIASYLISKLLKNEYDIYEKSNTF